MNPVPMDVMVERLRGRENAKKLVSSTFMCNHVFQEFLKLVLPDLEQSGPRKRDPVKEKQVREAAEKAIKEIRSYGFELRKAEAIEKTSERDIQDYSNQRAQIEESIKGVQVEIGALKEGLVVERKKRKNKEAYEEACKDINKYPPHRATKLAIEKLEKELVSLDERKRALQAVQRLKHKQIALLLQSLADIEATVEEGEMETEDEPTEGALELVGVDEDLAGAGGDVEGEAADDGDDEGDATNDGEEEAGQRRRDRKRSPSAETDDGAGRPNGARPSAPSVGAVPGEDAEMPDVA